MPSSGHHRKTITYKIKANHSFKKFSYVLSASTPTILTGGVFSFLLLDNYLFQNIMSVCPASLLMFLSIQLFGCMHKYIILYFWWIAVHSRGKPQSPYVHLWQTLSYFQFWATVNKVAILYGLIFLLSKKTNRIVRKCSSVTKKAYFKTLLIYISQVTWKFYKTIRGHSTFFSVKSLSNKCVENLTMLGFVLLW